jgi:hypothetical protein
MLQGHPFMESLWENKPLLYSVLASTTTIVCLASGMLPDMAHQFEIVELETEVSATDCKAVEIHYCIVSSSSVEICC